MVNITYNLLTYLSIVIYFSSILLSSWYIAGLNLSDLFPINLITGPYHIYLDDTEEKHQFLIKINKYSFH